MGATSHILGVILAGGGGRRMFAAPEKSDGAVARGDKGLIDLDGRPMLAHVIERLAPQVGGVILNANGDPARFAAFDLEVVADTDASLSGPLGGFAAAMQWAERNRPDVRAVLTVSTDVPFLPFDLTARFIAAAGDGPAIAVSAGQRHPAIGLWPITLKCEVFAALQSGRRRVETFAQHHEAIAVSFPFSEIRGRFVDPFFNANTPDDVAEARALLTG